MLIITGLDFGRSTRRAPAAKMRPFIVLGLCLLVSSCSFVNPDARKNGYVARGEKYLAAGKLPEAQIEFQNALQIDPRFAEADYDLALTYRGMGNFESAYRAMSDAATLDPSNVRTQIGLADILIARRQLRQAESILTKALDADPRNGLGHAILGKEYTLSGKRPEAIQEFQKAIECDPARIENYAALAANYLAAGQGEKAERVYQQGIKANPASAQAQLFLGEYYLALRNMVAAEAALRTACRLDPHSIPLRFFLARILVLAGKQGEAEKTYTGLKEMAPDNPQAYRALGLFYVSIGEKDKAVTEFRSLSRSKPADLSVKSHLVETLLDLGRNAEAETVNREILRTNPNEPGALIAVGRILIAKQSYAEAVTALRQAVKSRPNSSTAYYFLGVGQQSLGLMDLAKSSFAHALKLEPGRTEAELALANLDVQTGDDPDALRLSERILKAHPGLPLAMVVRAQALIDNKEMGQGEAALKDALGNDPFYLPALAQVLKLCIVEGKAPQAVQELTELVKKRPENAGLYMLLAVGYFNLKDLNQSETNVRKAIRIDSHTPDAYTLLANIDIAKGQMQQAEKDLGVAIDTIPNNISNYIALGTCYERENRWEDAKRVYAKAHELAPDSPTIAIELAYLYLDHGGDANIAASLAQAAQKRMPNSPSAADALGWAYYKLGSAAISVDELEKCVRLFPKNPLYQYHLGMSYLAVRRVDAATRSLRTALNQDPNSPFAANIKGALQQAGEMR